MAVGVVKHEHLDHAEEGLDLGVERTDQVSLVVVTEEVPHAVAALILAPGAADLRSISPDNLGEVAGGIGVAGSIVVVHVNLGIPAVDGLLGHIAGAGKRDSIGVLGVLTGMGKRSVAVVGPAERENSELIIPLKGSNRDLLILCVKRAVLGAELVVDPEDGLGEGVASLNIADVDGRSGDRASRHETGNEEVLEGDHFEVVNLICRGRGVLVESVD